MRVYLEHINHLRNQGNLVSVSPFQILDLALNLMILK